MRSPASSSSRTAAPFFFSFVAVECTSVTSPCLLCTRPQSAHARMPHDNHVAATYRHAYRTSWLHGTAPLPLLSCDRRDILPNTSPFTYLLSTCCYLHVQLKKKNSVKGHQGHNRLGCVLGWLGCFRCGKMLQGGVWRDLHCTHGIKVPLPEDNLLRTCTSLCVAMFIEINNLVV